MKIKLLILLAFLFNVLFLKAQTQWLKYPDNPVFTKGSSYWDTVAVGQPTCLIENDTIKMWYVAVGGDWKARISYAWSLNGITWTKHNNGYPVLSLGNQGEWDRGWLDTPEIVKDSNGYKLYYYGDTAWQPSAISSAMGVAHSTDGINWIKDPGNPIFNKGNPGEWDETWVESPAVIYDGISGEYKMWYNGVDTSTWKLQIGLATSTDGINWNRYPGNPVVPAGNWGAYDDMWVGTPSVIFENGYYKMWYSSTSSLSYNTILQKFDTVHVCYATSPDGINWTKFAGNPLFNTYTSPYDSLIDTDGPWAPDVIFDADSNKYKMWFETISGFLLATAPVTNTGINTDFYGNNSLFIYPNPVSNSTIIKTEVFLENGTLTLFDNAGKIINQKNNLKGNTFTFNKNNLKKGVYILQLKENEMVLTKNIIVE